MSITYTETQHELEVQRRILQVLANPSYEMQVLDRVTSYLKRNDPSYDPTPSDCPEVDANKIIACFLVSHSNT